jgi:hypothetical protein
MMSIYGAVKHMLKVPRLSPLSLRLLLGLPFHGTPTLLIRTLVSARHTQQEAIAWLIILRADSFVSFPISGSF